MRLTKSEKRALAMAAVFALAGEWDEIMDQRERDALERALQKLREDPALKIADESAGEPT